MNVVDSSAWLEYFAGSPRAEYYAAAIEDTDKLLVPVITIFEVFKKILSQRGEDHALTAIAHMKQARVIDLTESLALSAARLSHHHRIPLADSIILATAQAFDAELWTQDADFEGLPGVRFFEK